MASDVPGPDKDFWDSYLKDCYPEPFPCLTGLRQEKRQPGRDSTTLESPEPFATLQYQAKKNNVDLQDVFYAAWACILQAYSEREVSDVVFAALRQINDQTIHDIECKSGLIITPVRIRNCDKNYTNTEILEDLQRHRNRASGWSDSRCLDRKISKDSTASPVLHTGILFEYGEKNAAVTRDCLGIAGQEYDVLVHVKERQNRNLGYTTRYSSELLNEKAAKIMLNQLNEIAIWISENPHECYRDALGTVSRSLTSIIDAELNFASPEELLHHRFEHHARITPNNTALKFVESHNKRLKAHNWTYKKLNDAAIHVAACLEEELFRSQRRVVLILMEKCPELYITILATLKAGASWCPIDSLSPISRQHDLITRVGSSILAVNEHIAGYDCPHGVTATNISTLLSNGRERTTTSQNTVGTPVSKPRPVSPAYIIYTSGTTGPPKGVIVSHTASVASMNSLCQVIPGPTKQSHLKCMQFSQQTFDVFVQDLFYTWGLGGTIVSASRETMSTRFADIANFTKATHAHLTPAFGGSLARKVCPTLEVITMIGEKLPQTVAVDWGTDMKAFNTYGPAEAAVVSTVKRFQGKDEMFASSNIGLPLPSVSAYVLRSTRVTLQNGVGELALSGLQLADGYLNNDTRTEEKFIWHAELNKRIYMTGDIVRYLADGTLDFLGREDDLVKVQGIRVELSEISYALAESHPLIRQVEVMHLARSDRPSKVLVAFVAATVDDMPELDGLYLGATAASIAASTVLQAKNRLPSYMQPGVVLILKVIPRTTSAKIDRKALQALYNSINITAWESTINSQLERNVDQEQQWTSRERSAIEAVAMIAGIDSAMIRPSSVLSALGIDSIVAASLSSALKDKGMKIPVSIILQCRKIRELLSNIDQGDLHQPSENNSEYFERFEQHWRPIIGSKTGGISHVLPATVFQESVLAESLLDSTAYWSSHTLRLPETTDLSRLKEAWTLICAKTQALRVCFVPTAELHGPHVPNGLETTFLQLIHSEIELPWAVHNLRGRDLNLEAQDMSHKLALRCADQSFQFLPWSVSVLKHDENAGLVMLLIIHHSIHDANSINFVFQDLESLYNDSSAYCADRAQLSTAVTLTHQPGPNHSVISFWEDALRDYQDPDGIQFPDLTGSSKSCAEKGLVHSKIDSSFHELSRLVSELKISTATIFRAAWAYVLLQYLECPKLVLGDVLSERSFHTEIHDAVAPLISVLPLPVSARENGRDLLTTVEAVVKDSRAHRQIAPKTVRKLLRRPPNTPLYPAVFVFHTDDQPFSHSEWEKIEDFTDLNVEHTLALNVKRKTRSQFVLEVFADNRKVTPAHARLIVLQVEAVVDALSTNLDISLNTILHTSESSIISRVCTRLPSSVSDSSRSHATYWLSRHAREHPEWNAVELAGVIMRNNTNVITFTYADLEARSNQWANYFVGKKLYQNVIGVCLGRCLDLYAITIGILKSGNIYLPIDESLPTQRKHLLIEDSQSQAIVIDTSMRSMFTDLSSRITVVEVREPLVADEILKQSSEHIQVAEPDDSAYILYTSGSTGKPKGVIIPHRGLCGFVEGLRTYISSCSQGPIEKQGIGKWLGLSSRAFDVHLCEMFLGWRLGLSFATAPREMILDDLKTALIELKITHAAFVPSLLDQAGIEPGDVPDLVYFSVGGEKVSQKILQIWGTQNKTLVVNAYGPTEVSIGCCASAIGPTSTARNIGRPFGNSAAHVLIPSSINYALTGQSGELCVTGDLVGTGYLNRPDAEGFINDFYGERMFRTGDTVRMLANGTLEYLGRDDDQAKIRGQRIELGEITQCLQDASPRSLDMATLLLQHPDLPGTQLISFIAHSVERSERYDAIPETSKVPAYQVIDHLTEECRRKLPSFMVPNYILPVSVLPLARISGKADAKLLKIYFNELSIQHLLSGKKATNAVKELNEHERKVAKAVSETLNVDVLGVTATSSVLELGIDSLAAINLAIRLRKYGFECSMADVLTRQTIELLARLPKSKQSRIIAEDCISRQMLDEFDKHYRPLLQLEESNIEYLRPCLPLQEGLIGRSLNLGNKKLYINHLTINFPEHVNFELLKNSWIFVVQRTPILRTSFRSVENKVVQLIHQSGQYFRWQSVAAVTHEMDAIVADIQAEATTSILESLLSEPSLRLSEIRGETSPSRLCIALHHAIYDAVSLNHVLNDVYQAYHFQTPIVRTPFDNLLSYLLRQSEDEQKRFWMKHLADLKTTTFKFAEFQESNTITTNITMPLAKLQSQATKAKVTLGTFCQTLFATVLAKSTSSLDVAFGVIFSGRGIPIEGAESIPGPCITTIPQRVRFAPEVQNFQGLSQILQQSIAKCLTHQHTPLRKIHQWLGKDRLFDALFQYIGELEESALYTREWKITGYPMPDDFPLNVQFQPRVQEDRLQVTISCLPSFGGRDRVKEFYETLNHLFVNSEQIEPLDFIGVGIVPEQVNILQPRSCKSVEQPLDGVEATIRKVLVQYTGIPARHIRKSTTFFFLGVDSISVLELARRLRNVDIQVRGSELMQYSCIRDLSEHLKRKDEALDVAFPNAEDDESDDPVASSMYKHLDLDFDQIEAIYSCTPLQSGMLSATLASDGSMYVLHHVFKVQPRINVRRLLNDWAIVRRARDILRTSFRYDSVSPSPWIAVVHKVWDSDSQIVQVNDLPTGLEAIRQQMIFELPEDFNSPPVRTQVLQVADENFLVLSLHHAIYDGLSIPMILDDLLSLYDGDILSHRPPFWRAARSINQFQERQAEFWAESLEGYIPPPINFSLDSTCIPICIRRKLSVDMEGVAQLCQAMGVTIQSAALLAYAKVLAVLYKQRDIVFGHVISGRSIALQSVEHIVGPLFNTVPFRVQLDSDISFNDELAGQIQAFTGRAQDYQHAPLHEVLKIWRRSYHGSSRPIHALFLFQRILGEMTTDIILQAQKLEHNSVRPEYRLNLEVEQHQTHFAVIVSSYEDCYDRTQLENIVDLFGACFQEVVYRSRSVVEFPDILQILPFHAAHEASSNDDKRAISTSKDGVKEDFDVLMKIVSDFTRVPVQYLAPDSSIYSLGIDSILAIKFASICKENGLRLSVADIVQGETLEGICLRAGKATNRISIPSTSATIPFSSFRNLHVSENHIETILSCLGGQSYHMYKLSSSFDQRLPTFVYTAGARLDTARLEHALNELAKSNSIFRTLLNYDKQGNCAQVVLKAERLDHKISLLQDPDDTEETLYDKINSLSRSSSVASFEPQLQLTVLRQSKKDLLLLSIHHALYDAYSLPMLIDDLTSLYHGNTLQSRASFEEFTKHQLSLPQSTNSETHSNYWHQRLRSISPSLVTKSSRALSQSSVFVSHISTIDHSVVEQVAKGLGVSMQAILISAFASQLASSTDLSNAVFGHFVSGRSTYPNGAEVFGPCLNVLPFVVRDAVSLDIKQKIQTIQADIASNTTYEQSNLTDILKMWQQSRTMNQSDCTIGNEQLFNTYLNILPGEHGRENTSSPFFTMYDIDLERYEAYRTSKTVDSDYSQLEYQDHLVDEALYVDVVLRGKGGKIEINAKSEVGLMDSVSLRRWLERFEQAITDIVE